MRNASNLSASRLRNSRRQLWRSGEGMRWAVAIAITAAVMAVFLTAVAFAPASIRANNDLCLRQIAKDEHTSLEAFFQNPAQQDAFVQAVTVCAR